MTTAKEYIQELLAEGKTTEQIENDSDLLFYYKNNREIIRNKLQEVIAQQQSIQASAQQQSQKPGQQDKQKKKYPLVVVRLSKEEYSFIKAQTYMNPSQVVHKALKQLIDSQSKESP